MSSTTPLPDHINYAKYTGFDSLAPAIIFAILYIPFFAWFVIASYKRPTTVYRVLAIFSLIRVVAFIIRAVLVKSEAAGENLGLLVADEILFGVGFAGLLYSSYTLVLDLALLADHPAPQNPIVQITQNRRVFRLVMTAAVVLGITSASIAGANPTSTSNALHDVSTVVFLLLTILLAFQTVYLARLEMLEPENYSQRPNPSFGTKHGIIILVIISLLLLVREAFATGTLNNHGKQNNEHFWYPLIAVPEILAIALYSIPGLIPSNQELPK